MSAKRPKAVPACQRGAVWKRWEEFIEEAPTENLFELLADLEFIEMTLKIRRQHMKSSGMLRQSLSVIRRRVRRELRDERGYDEDILNGTDDPF